MELDGGRLTRYLAHVIACVRKLNSTNTDNVWIISSGMCIWCNVYSSGRGGHLPNSKVQQQMSLSWWDTCIIILHKSQGKGRRAGSHLQAAKIQQQMSLVWKDTGWKRWKSPAICQSSTRDVSSVIRYLYHPPAQEPEWGWKRWESPVSRKNSKSTGLRLFC